MFHRLIWNLRTDPFYPETVESGESLSKAAAETSLNPTIDARVLNLYFDVYDWSCSHHLGGLSNQAGLVKFPTSRTLLTDSPLLIIISGARQTGIDSLGNLILHKIECVSGAKPLVIDVVFESRDKNRNVTAVVRSMIDCIEWLDPPVDDATAILKRLEDRYTRLADDVEQGRDARFTEMFKVLHKVLAPLRREVVVRIGKGDNDSWARIQECLSGSFSYVLVGTADAAHAKTCYAATSQQQQNVAWIRAEPLDEQKTRDYIKHRLLAQRIATAAGAPASNVYPFTDEAIRALFEPGTVDAPRSGIRHPVGWLRKALHHAIADRIETLKKAYPDLGNDGASAAPLDQRVAAIGSEQMRAACERLNGRF